jgi:rhodanese-related sulfurtransferase
MHAMAAPNEISVPQLLRLIGTPTAPTIIDLSLDDDHADDPFLIPGSVRHPHTDLAGLKQRIGTTGCVILCQKGLKLSQGMVARLQADGIAAEYLAGGMYAWRDHPLTTRIPVAALPHYIDGASLWVTRHRPKIDRIACPWLIRRFVDADARFLFVSPSEVQGVAERYGATPFDIEDVEFSHIGDRCTFDTMLDVFALHSDPLDKMAQVIRAADTNRHDLAPEAAGLLALSVGMSRQYRNDQEQLSQAMPIYDALYRWARDGAGEGHDWPQGRAG